MGNNPGWVTGKKPSAAEWNAEFASKQDNITGSSITASMLASGAAAANIAGGPIAPSSVGVVSGPLTLGSYTMTGGTGFVATIPSTYGTWDQAVGASVVVNSTHGPEVDGFNASGYLNFPGVANYPGRDSVAFYADNTGPAPIATVAGTFTTTTFVPTVALSGAIVAKLKVGMFIDTTDATKYTGTITGWASDGTSITVSAWYQMGNTAAGQTPSGPNAVISPITGVWAANFQTFLSPTSYANNSIGLEIDVNNNKAAYSGHGVDTTAWGFYVGNSGTYNGAIGYYQAGAFWNGFKSQQAQNAAYLAEDYTAQNPGTAFQSNQTSGLHFGAYVGGKWRFQVDNRGFIYLGDQGAAQNTAISLYSSGRTTWDSQIYSAGGTASQGNGALAFVSGSHSFYEASQANDITIKGATTGNSPSVSASGSDATVNLSLYGKGSTHNVALGGIGIGSESVRVLNVASQVNALYMAPAATGGSPALYGTGTDSTVNLSLYGKNNGIVGIGGSGLGSESLRVTSVASQVNDVQIVGAVTTSSPVISARGSDTNINLALTPKGTGTVQVTVNGLQLPTYTVSALPACTAANAGTIAYVTDASAPSYNATIAGGGAIKTLVMSNGTNWTAH